MPSPLMKLPSRNWLAKKKKEQYVPVDVEAGGAEKPPSSSRRSSTAAEEATDESSYYAAHSKTGGALGLVERAYDVTVGAVVKQTRSGLDVKMASVRRATRMTGGIIRHGLDDPLDGGNHDKLLAFDRLWEYVSGLIYAEVSDDSDLSPMQKTYRETLVVGWRSPTPLRGPHGKLQLFEWLRSKVLYMLFPANKAVANNTTMLWFLLITMFPCYGSNAWLYLLLFLSIDKTDEFQLVQYICLDKSIQFLACGFVPAVSNGYQYLSCLQHIEAGDVGWCSQVYASTIVELALEPLRIGCVWVAFLLLATGRAHGGSEQTMALEAVRAERAHSGVYDHAKTRARQDVARRAVWRRLHETSAQWRSEHLDFDPDVDPQPQRRRLRWLLDPKSGEATWWIDYQESAGGFLFYFAAWDIVTTVLVFGIAICSVVIGQDDPAHYIFWKVFDFARMCQALLSFPFLIFALPLVQYPLTGAQPTGYDATGTLCPQLGGAQLRDCRDEDDRLVNEVERLEHAALYTSARQDLETKLRDDLATIRKDASLSEHERKAQEHEAKRAYTAKIERLVKHEKETAAASGGRKNSSEEKQFQSGSIIKHTAQGEVHLTLTWTRKARGDESFGRLAVALDRGVGLKPTDSNGLADPYVKLRWCAQKHKSHVAKEDLNPYWEQRFEFKACSLGALKEAGPLELEVKDHDAILKRSFKAAGKSKIHKDLSLLNVEQRNTLADNESMGGAKVDLAKLHAKVQKSKTSDVVSIDVKVKLADISEQDSAGMDTFLDSAATEVQTTLDSAATEVQATLDSAATEVQAMWRGKQSRKEQAEK